MKTQRRLGVLRRSEGQTMVEYSIVAALIAVVAMVAVQALGVGISAVFTDIVDSITTM